METALILPSTSLEASRRRTSNMPSSSPKQARMMAAIAHGWNKPGGGGPSVSVAKEFNEADQGTGIIGAPKIGAPSTSSAGASSKKRAMMAALREHGKTRPRY